MRIDHKNLRKWLQDKLEYYGETSFKVVDSYTTRFTSDQYESGAAKLIFRLSSGPCWCSIYCYYSIKELRDHIRAGYSLQIKLNRDITLADAELGLVNHNLK